MLIRCFPAKTPLGILIGTILDCLRWSHTHKTLGKLHPCPPNANNTLPTHTHTHTHTQACTRRHRQIFAKSPCGGEPGEQDCPSLWLTELCTAAQEKQDEAPPAAVLGDIISVRPGEVGVRCHLWPESVQFSCSIVSDSLRPHGLQHPRPPCPSPTPRVY